MLNYIEYLNMPTKVAFVIAAIFFVMQVIGEVLEFRGTVVPEWIKIRKYFKRKKREREVLSQLPSMFEQISQVPDTLRDVRELLNNVEQHYSADNISQRDAWIQNVNHKLDSYDSLVQELAAKLDKNNEDTLSLLIDSKRTIIINFAQHVIDENAPVTREQFHRIFRIYEEYEAIIEANNMTNGEVDISYRIITESYEKHMRNHTFVEDLRGYDVTR